MESINKRAVMGIRKRTNETGDAVTKQERIEDGGRAGKQNENLL